MDRYYAACKCGYTSDAVASKTLAEVYADAHESSMRVAHKHDAVAVKARA